jgi:hypothetical protein
MQGVVFKYFHMTPPKLYILALVITRNKNRGHNTDCYAIFCFLWPYQYCVPKIYRSLHVCACILFALKLHSQGDAVVDAQVGLGIEGVVQLVRFVGDTETGGNSG